LCIVGAVELTADYEHQQVVLRHLGKKTSATSSQQLSQGDTICLGNEDALWLLPERYKHVVKFCDTNSSRGTSVSVTAGRKCRRSDEDGISLQSASKRHCSSSAPAVSDGRANDVLEEDSDSEQVETVCKMSFLLSRMIIAELQN